MITKNDEAIFGFYMHSSDNANQLVVRNTNTITLTFSDGVDTSFDHINGPPDKSILLPETKVTFKNGYEINFSSNSLVLFNKYKSAVDYQKIGTIKGYCINLGDLEIYSWTYDDKVFKSFSVDQNGRVMQEILALNVNQIKVDNPKIEIKTLSSTSGEKIQQFYLDNFGRLNEQNNLHFKLS